MRKKINGVFKGFSGSSTYGDIFMVPNFEIELTAAIISFNKISHHLEL
jgi:hypothetical protein